MIPRPVKIEKRDGEYKLTDSIENSVSKNIDASLSELGDEGYRLDVGSDGISLAAPAEAGLFYGMQTLKQMQPVGSASDASIRCQTITDKPHFKWRGLMIDTARYYFPVDFIKKQLDLMAMHKLNVFHWHLVEDQGWRIEIKKHPKLVEIGSRRRESPLPSDRDTGDGKPYEGYYTQDEIREIVSYAADRFITVVPEIELPGHSLAALAAYPELGCTGGPYEVESRWGIKKDVYCAGNDKVFEMLEDVFDEVLDLFPSKFIHIGGDECPKARWIECSKCQARIKGNGLKDEYELQSYFITRIEKFLNSRGRSIIGWDEILEGGLAPNAAVMSWRGIEGGVKAAKSGHDVVMSPKTHCYLDYYQGVSGDEPPAIGGHLPLASCYEFDPVPRSLSSSEAECILGGQGNLWTEYIPTPELAEYMMWPRVCALSEVMWTYAEAKNFSDFSNRLVKHLKIFDELGVDYRKLD